jgi:NAD(P)-dependent dehydrogenase (short-subunit alcohol dehydrogenase family)
MALCTKHDGLQNSLDVAARGSIYAAAISGILTLTKTAAHGYATSGILINALSASTFRPLMQDGTFGKANRHAPFAGEDHYKTLLPMQSIGRPLKAAETILWLPSEDA